MSSWTELMRSWLKPAPRKARRSRSRLGLEALETRDTPSIVVTGTPPTWQPTGPAPGGITNAGVVLGSAAQNIQVGAVNQIAVDPFDPTHLALAAVNGGVWTTNNYPSNNLTWATTTDNMPSLAISSVAFSPAIQGVVYAGTGSYTSGGGHGFFSAGVTNPGVGGAAVGLYKSTDGGTSWSQLGADVFSGLRIRDVLPTRLTGGQTVYVDTSDGGPGTFGIYESDDGGVTWTRQSGANGLPDLGVTSIVADPGDPNRFYAVAVGSGGGAGVYMLDVTGGNNVWVNITSNLPPVVTTGARVLLSASPAGVDPVYAAVVVIDPNTGGGTLQGVYRAVPFSTPGGTSPTYVWTAVGPGGLPPDISPGDQADLHFAIAADPTSDSLVYVAGDRTGDIVNGTFPGSAARGDAIADTWTTITVQPNPVPPPTPGTVTPLNPGPQPTTAPHADFRGLTFIGNNTILAGTDGGAYQVVNPRAVNGPPVWSSDNGNLAVTEVYQVDVDNHGTASTADDVYMMAAQDNSESEATFGGDWSQIGPGDGTLVRADDVNGYRYYSGQNFGLTRRNPDGSLISVFDPTPNTLTRINGTGFFLAGNTPFQPVMALNQADTNLMLIGDAFGSLYLSRDHADSFDSIAGVSGGVPNPVPNVTSTATAIAFGTTQIRNAAYVATDDGNISQSFDITTNSGNFTVTSFKQAAGGAVAYSVAMDPTNPLIAYALTNNGVFRTIDGGRNWVNMTGTLGGLATGGGLVKFGSMTLFTNGTATSADDALVVGVYGGVYVNRVGQTLAAGTVGPWQKFGDGIPNVLVNDVRYDPLANTIVAGTYGRGGFRMTNAAAALIGGPVITVTGNPAVNNMAVYPDPTDPTKFVVADGLGNTQSFSLSSFRNVVFKGQGGADTVTVGSPDATQAGSTALLGLVVSVDTGGDVGDTLVIQDAADPTGHQTTVTPTTIGGGTGDDLFPNAGSVTYTGLNKGTVQFRFGPGADSLKVDDTANTAGASFAVTATRVTRSLGGTYDYSGADLLSVLGGSGNDTFNIQSTAVPTIADGGAGNDAFAVASDAPANAGDLGPLGGTLVLTGGTGSDTARVNATAGDDAVTARITSAAGDGNLAGLPVAIGFTGMEQVGYDGRGGSNAVTVEDDSDTVYGSPTNPGAGIVYAPTGPTSGSVRFGNGIQVFVASVTSQFAVSGDGDGSGDKDTLVVLGTSAPGHQSAFGEAAIGDGRDVISVADTGVRVQTITGTQLLPVVPGTTAGAPTFTTLYVAGGNEAGPGGDQITASPSPLMNILVDGQGPLVAPGDKLTVLGPGPFTTFPSTDPTLGPPQTRVIAGDGTTMGYLGVEDTGLGADGFGSGMVAVATDAGPETRVQVYDRLSGALRFQITPFPGFNGGATVASGDVTGDGIADLIVGAGPGGGPRVAIFNGLDGTQLADFFAYEPTFRGGVNVSAADVNRDGFSDLVLGTGVGGGPRVRILSGKDYSVIRDVFAYESTFRGGVNVAAGDFNGDGIPDLITSAGAGGGPRVVVFSGADLRQLASFFVFDPNSRTGFYATAADVDGDGRADVIVGNGAGGPAEVRVFNSLSRSVIRDFFVTDPVQPAGGIPAVPVDFGVRVAAADINGDGIDDVVTVKGPGAPTPTIRAYQVTGVNPQTHSLFPTLAEIRHQDVFDGVPGLGLFVGAGD